MPNPWDPWSDRRSNLEALLEQDKSRRDEILRDLPTAEANVQADPANPEPRRVRDGLNRELVEVTRRIDRTQQDLANLYRRRPAPSTTGTEENGVIRRIVFAVGVVTTAIILIFVAIFAIEGGQRWWNNNHAGIEKAIDDLLPDGPDCWFLCSYPDNGSSAPTTPSSAPGATPRPAPSQAAYVAPCTVLPGNDGIKLDGTQPNLVSDYNKGSWIHLQFFTRSGEHERDTLIPTSVAGRAFAKRVSGTVWYYSPACTQDMAMADINRAISDRQADPSVHNDGFVPWDQSGLY